MALRLTGLFVKDLFARFTYRLPPVRKNHITASRRTKKLVIAARLLAACSITALASGEALGALACPAPCTAGGECRLIMPLPRDAEQAILSATRSLVLGDGATVTTSKGVPEAVANLGRMATVVGDHTTVGGVYSNASVELGVGAVVNGPLKTGETVRSPFGAVVKGSVTTHDPIASNQRLVTTVTFSATAVPVNIPAGGTQKLAPAEYGDIRVEAGETLSLTAGTYHVASLTVLAEGALELDETAGAVVIYVKGAVKFAGRETQIGADGHVLIAAFGCEPDVFAAPFRGTVSAQNGALSLVTEAGGKFAGRYFANSIQLGAENSLTGLNMTLPDGPTAKGPTAALPAPLPLPPRASAKPGCYENTLNGWREVPCATDAFIDSHFPHPDVQLGTQSAAVPSLVFGQVEVTVPKVSSEQNAFLASTASISSLCQSTGSPVPNQCSVQNNVNFWTIPSGTNAGDTAQAQFTIQSDGTTNAICIWNVDVTINTLSAYHKTCYVPPPPQTGNPAQRPGGLQAFDSGNIAAYTNSNGTLSMVAQLTWAAPGQPTQYAVVGVPDVYGLNGNWSEVGGGLIGFGSCSQAQLTNAEVVTQVIASTCTGDTAATSPTCVPPTLQPNESAFIGAIGTVETNNLIAVGTPSVSYPNSDLAVTTSTGTTSGGCLGPSHAYVKDNLLDFGATPSNLGGQVFWESPDIFLVPRGTPVDLTSVSAETTITPGGLFDIWIRVHNDLGCSAVTNVKSLVYLADPAALSIQWSPVTNGQFVGDNGGSTGVTAPAGGEALIGPIPFTAPSTGLGDGHKCILAAIEADGEPAPTNTFDAPDSNQVAQRNLQFVGPCVFPLTNGTTSNGQVQITLSVTPSSGVAPSLTALPDVEVSFDDSDSSWFDLWSAQTGNGSTFTVTHAAATGLTTVRLGAFSVVLNQVQLAAGQTSNATGTTILPSGTGDVTLQIGAILTEQTSAGQTVVVSNGGSCVTTPPPVIQQPK
jgi:hypothetical protein